MTIALGVLVAYLVGGIPFALLAGRLRGVDVRRHGSGNIGGSNAIRVLGPALGVPVLLLDIVKGLVAVTAIPALLGLGDPRIRLLFGVAAIAGHVWPVYLRFRGGKGVATAAGAFLGLAPIGTAIALGVFAVVLAVGRFVSLASMAGAVALAVALRLLDAPPSLQWAGIAIALLVVLRHRSNIRRILAGEESRITRNHPRKGAL
jgi:glycerol-3-phosphate acyltransferase PlsY